MSWFEWLRPKKKDPKPLGKPVSEWRMCMGGLAYYGLQEGTLRLKATNFMAHHKQPKRSLGEQIDVQARWNARREARELRASVPAGLPTFRKGVRL